MTSKTIIIGLVALAFVAGSIMTGTMADAKKDDAPKIDLVAEAIDNLTAVMQGTATQGPQGDQGDQGLQGDAASATVLDTYQVEGTNLTTTDRFEDVYCDSGDIILTGYFKLTGVTSSSTIPVQRSSAIHSQANGEGWDFAVSDAIGVNSIRVFIECLDLDPLRP